MNELVRSLQQALVATLGIVLFPFGTFREFQVCYARLQAFLPQRPDINDIMVIAQVYNLFMLACNLVKMR